MASYLKKKFRVCIVKNQEEGNSRGSILSVTFFNIKINNVIKELPSGIDGSLYVGDLMICFKSTNIHTIERKLQQGLEKISRWAIVNGFRFSKTKTCVHFCCKKKKLRIDPSLKLDFSKISVVDEYRFLGIIFDKKLTFTLHLKN